MYKPPRQEDEPNYESIENICGFPQLFVASVLLEPELALTPMPSPAHHGYGAMASSQGPSHGPVEGEEDHAQTHETELRDPPDAYCAGPLMDSPVDDQ